MSLITLSGISMFVMAWVGVSTEGEHPSVLAGWFILNLILLAVGVVIE